jgi:multidrug resistance efflux pump
MKATKLIVIVVILLAVAGGTIGLLVARGRHAAAGPATATVSRRDLSATLTATGIVRAMVGAEVKVGAQVSGKVLKLYANIGDKVQAGQVIALIDDRDFRARVAQAQADVAAAEAKWRQAAASAAVQPSLTAAVLAQARSGVGAAASHLHQAQVTAQSQPISTGSQIEQARRTLAAAQARLEQARASAAAQPQASQAQIAQATATLRAAEASLTRVKRGARSEEIAQAQAAVRQAEATLKQAEADLGRAQTLFNKGYLSEQDLDSRRTARDVAQEALQTACERLDMVKTQTLPEDLDKAQAEVAQAQAGLEQAMSAAVQVQLRQQDVTAAEAEVQRAQAALQAAQAGRSQDEIARQQVVSTQADVANAEAGYRSAEANTVQNELQRRAADAARAQLMQAQAALRSAQTQLSYTRIAAPISGIIASVTTQEGETVSAGLAAPTFVTIIDLSRLEVDAYVDETDIGKVKLGQEATFTVDAYADKEFTGQVTAVYPKALTQQNVVQYDTVVTVTDTQQLLKPDMTANVTISAERHPQVLSVPNKAIRRENGQKVVYVLEGGTVVPHPVKTGVRDTQYTEILSGVEDGMTVLVGEPEATKSKATNQTVPTASPQGKGTQS